MELLWLWILGWFVSILTVIGNGFVILLVYSKQHLRTKTNALIVSLAVVDFLVGLHVIPLMFSLEVIGPNYPKDLDKGLYIILRLRWLFQDASILCMCSLVLDRYLAVVKPLKYLRFMTSSRVIQLISFSWGAAAAFILLQSFLWVKSRGPLVVDTFRWLVIIIFHAFPCVLIFFCFASMLRVIYKQRREAHVLGRQRPFNNRREKSALIMMSIVVALFLVYCAIYIGCVLKVITDECDGYIQRIALFNSNFELCCKPIGLRFLQAGYQEGDKKINLQNVRKKSLVNRRCQQENSPSLALGICESHQSYF